MQMILSQSLSWSAGVRGAADIRSHDGKTQTHPRHVQDSNAHNGKLHEWSHAYSATQARFFSCQKRDSPSVGVALSPQRPYCLPGEVGDI